MAKDLVIVLAGGAGERLLLLSEERAKPAVPFAGHYRIIDFTLSNCVNSGLFEIFMLTQYMARSLLLHLDHGKPWHLGGLGTNLVVLQPHHGAGGLKWYLGTADAVWRNIYLVHEHSPRNVLILAGDHIYKMDYRPMLEFHRNKKALLTVGVKAVDPSQATLFGTCRLDEDARIVEFVEKSSKPSTNLASMGIYVFDPDALESYLEEDSQDWTSSHDFGKNIVPKMIASGRVYGYLFSGYWQDVGTVETYFEANMSLISHSPPIDLDDPTWRIYTKFDENPPAKFGSNCKVRQSIICDGALIQGTVEKSMISPGVVVEEDAVVRDSIILRNSRIRRGAKINLAIVDEKVEIGAGATIGSGIDFSPNIDYPGILRSGITMIGKSSIIPQGSRIGRNCLINLKKSCDNPLDIPSGRSLLD
ncbi:MAG: glucose-1-phosphate adenylyltransferase family protein [bacterium]